MSIFKNLFNPSVETLVKKELERSRIGLLAAYSAMEACQAQVAFTEARIKRLEQQAEAFSKASSRVGAVDLAFKRAWEKAETGQVPKTEGIPGVALSSGPNTLQTPITEKMKSLAAKVSAEAKPQGPANELVSAVKPAKVLKAKAV